MKIYVNNTDITDKTAANSVKWRRYGTFRSELSFTLEVLYSEGAEIGYGMSARLEDDFSQTLFNGTVTQTREEYRSGDRKTVSVRCKGPESVLSRRFTGSFTSSATYTGDAAKDVFLAYLSGGSDEGFIYNPAFFSRGAAINGFSVRGKSLARVFDELGSADGSRWWVLPDGSFYFMNRIETTLAPFCVDLTGAAADRLTDITTFETVKDACGYRNVQYVVGENGFAGEAVNSAEIAAMARLGGTGRYENAVYVPMISTLSEANAAAENILRSYDGNNFNVVFTTRADGLRLFDRITVTAPQFGLNGPAAFVVTEIAARDRSAEGTLAFIYRVQARMMTGNTAYCRPPEYWTETLSRISV